MKKMELIFSFNQWTSLVLFFLCLYVVYRMYRKWKLYEHKMRYDERVLIKRTAFILTLQSVGLLYVFISNGNPSAAVMALALIMGTLGFFHLVSLWLRTLKRYM
jgi:FlaA1/EpsC-like NDP-sugar epimerase